VRSVRHLPARSADQKPSRFVWSGPSPTGGGAKILLVTVLAGLAFGLFMLYRSGWLWQLPDWIRGCGIYGIAISYVLIVFQAFVPFAPFALLAGGNALVHGFWIGYLTTWAGAYTGALLLYLVSRSTLQGPLAGRLRTFLQRHPRVERYRTRLGRERGWSLFSFVLVLRMQPWLPSSVIDVSAGAARVPFLPFAVASFLGQAPMIALESYVGHRLMTPREHAREVWVMVGVGLVMLVGYLLWRWRQAKGKDAR